MTPEKPKIYVTQANITLSHPPFENSEISMAKRMKNLFSGSGPPIINLELISIEHCGYDQMVPQPDHHPTRSSGTQKILIPLPKGEPSFAQ
jgi:hypothetical protein